jgi:4-hydroxybenzoate polyprenyltransferase
LYLYFGGVFLTIAYDTIYGFQDIDDDKRIGVKSLSILIEKKSTLNLSILYFISFLSFTLFFFSFYDNILKNVLYSMIILISFIFQVLKFSKNETLIKIFNSNILFGGLLAILIVARNYL